MAWIKSCGALYGFSVLLLISSTFAQGIVTTPEPLPTRSTSVLNLSAFPSDLSCPDAGDVAEGPTWGEIIIGVSNGADLEEYVGTIGYYDSIDRWADYISFFRTGSLQDQTGPPSLIEACLDISTGVVTVLQALNNRPFYIHDLVSEYGIPDAVTWGSSNISRTVFWFDEGIAALVFILEESEILDYGEIGLLVYFPYQDVENYEKRWPFNQTNTENPAAGDRVYIPPPSEEQSPFNFDAIIATVTAQPSRTPTPTFSSPSSRTPTSQPATATAQP